MENNSKKHLIRLFALTIFMAVFAVCFAACDDDEKGSYPPAFYGFTYSPNPVKPGDSVTITAVQARKGQYLIGCDYSLNVRLKQEDGETNIVSKYHTNYDATNKANPTFKILIPANIIGNSAYVSFSARWNNSADGIGGEYSASDNSGYLGQIISRGYLLYSEASGNFNLPIEQ